MGEPRGGPEDITRVPSEGSYSMGNPLAHWEVSWDTYMISRDKFDHMGHPMISRGRTTENVNSVRVLRNYTRSIRSDLPLTNAVTSWYVVQ